MWLTVLLLRDYDGCDPDNPGVQQVFEPKMIGEAVAYPDQLAMRLVERGHAIPLTDAPVGAMRAIDDRGALTPTVRGGALHEQP